MDNDYNNTAANDNLYMKSSNKKKLWIGVVVLILIVGGIIYQINSKISLQENPYIDENGKFSINLPKNWELKNQINSTTTSDTWFYNPAFDQENPQILFVVKRFERNEKMNNTIKLMGEDQFLDALVQNMTSKINNYSVATTTIVNINDKVFRLTRGGYEGKNNGKKATQYLYLHLTEEEYYLIGLDIYDDFLPKYEKTLLESIKTFKIL